MKQTIEVEIDASGRIHPLEPLPFAPSGRALLTLLEKPAMADPSPVLGRAGDILDLLATPRYANRPVAKAEEVRQRITALRDDWGKSQ